MQPDEHLKPLQPYHKTTAINELLVNDMNLVESSLCTSTSPPFPSLMSTAAILATRALYCAKDDVPINIMELMTSLRRCSGFTWSRGLLPETACFYRSKRAELPRQSIVSTTTAGYLFYSILYLAHT